MLAGTGTGGFGAGAGAPGHQFPIPGYFHLHSHALNPMAHEGGDFGSPVVLSRNSAGAGFLQAPCTGKDWEKAWLLPERGCICKCTEEGRKERWKKDQECPTCSCSLGSRGAEIPDGKRVCSLIKMFWVCSWGIWPLEDTKVESERIQGYFREGLAAQQARDWCYPTPETGWSQIHPLSRWDQVEG